MSKLKVAVLISGRGSNLQALIDAAADPAYPAEIVSVVSNVPGVMGLERAGKAGLATATINHRDFAGREPFATAGYLLAKTERIKISSGIANVYARDADCAAQAANALANDLAL